MKLKIITLLSFAFIFNHTLYSQTNNLKDDPNARMEYERRMLADPATGKIPDYIREKELNFAKTLSSSNILESLAQGIGGANSIYSDYIDGKKWVAYFTAKPVGIPGIASGGIKLLVDLDDALGLTKEGKNGWVTIWVDVVASIGVGGGWPIGFGLQQRSFGANAPDSPTTLFDLTTNADLSYIPVELFKITSSGNVSTFDIELGTSTHLGIDESFTAHGLSFEIKNELLNSIFNNVSFPNISINDFVLSSILTLISPGNELFNNPFINFRLTTPQDDPDVFLIQDIYSNKLVEGIQGTVNVKVRVKESKHYKVRVWDDNGITYPNWNWVDKTSDIVYLEANQEYTFKLYVTPDSRLGKFSFWLYEKDPTLGVDTYKIIEKNRADVYSDPIGTDITPPQVYLTEPKYNSIVQDSIKIVVNASDENGISYLSVFLDNEYITSITQTPYQYWLHTNMLSNGEHKITIRGYDKDGNGAEDFVTILKNSEDKISISSVTLDKASYTPNENATISVNLENNLEGATVSFQINGTSKNLKDIGNGLYEKTFAVPLKSDTYNITVNAAKDGYIAAAPVTKTLTVSNPKIGHDIKAYYLTISKDNVNPGSSITIAGSVKNIGKYDENDVPVVLSIIDANGNVKDSYTENLTITSNEASKIIEHSFPTSSSWATGYYYAEIRSNLSNDYDPSNDFLNESFYLGTSPSFSQYAIDYLANLVKNQPFNKNGYKHTLTFIGGHNGIMIAKITVERNGYSQNKECKINELTYYDNNNYVLIYRANFNENAGVDYGLPSDKITISPNQLMLDAGSTGLYHVTTSNANPILNGSVFGKDGTIVQNWMQEKNEKTNSFDIEISIPLNANIREYKFWPEININNNLDIAQILSLNVHKPHNITGISITPISGIIDSIGKIIHLQGIFTNNGGYNEPNQNIKLEITGPKKFSFSKNFIRKMPIGVMDTIKYDLNSVGLESGEYTISFTAVLNQDPYNDNTLSTKINLIFPPLLKPLLISPDSSSVVTTLVPIFSWKNVIGATNYKLQVSNDTNFTAIVFNDTTITTTSKQVNQLENNKQYFWRVQAKNTENNSVWSSVWNFTTQQKQTGNLIVKVKNVIGGSTQIPGNNGIIKLYEGNNLVYTQNTKNDTASFNNINVGNYWFEAYHNPSPSTIFGQEFWGESLNIGVISGKTTDTSFIRNMPYIQFIKVYNGNTEVTGQTVTQNTPLTIKVTAKNNATIDYPVKSRIVIDRNKTSSYDYDQIDSAQIIPSNGSTKIYEFKYTPTVNGDYYGIAGAITTVTATDKITDGWSWNNTKLFIVTDTDTSKFALLYLKNGDPNNWLMENASGSQYKEISVWDSAGYNVTKMNLGTTTITSTLLNNYKVLRINGTSHGAITNAEGTAIYNWVQNGGMLLVETPYTDQVPGVKQFGVETINGQNGGSTGREWYYFGAPKTFGPVINIGSTINSIACESMDRPILSNGNNLSIDATIDNYPAIVSGIFGKGKVIIIFVCAWSHDKTYPNNAYRANIFQDDNILFLKNIIEYLTEPVTDVKNSTLKIPTQMALSQNYPNPFNPTTVISYELPKSGLVQVKVFNILGQEIAILVNKFQNAGYYKVTFDAAGLNSGIYIYKLQVGNFTDVKKMILLK